ncbi:TPA: hypothetical protein JBB06_03275 [Legionella pneumophila subsp. pneumophila]|nr:hypothetical protein [Legionella pneumophila]HAT8938547.1 hypothetical protein [Legionella pneumophila subsp. pneumophila]HAT4426924.1 hypothetical protein [Legionella pneumophila]HAT9032075.1 hypothetical protein [Legionella pneumophila subsp. pneumophila]HAU2257154.1 hypothetical protein [Legionella pneumophila]
MEIILVLILISILWGISKLSSILSILENIEFELRHGNIETRLCKTNDLLDRIKDTIPDRSTDYTYELEKIHSQLESINDEFKWYESSSFAGSQREQLEKINENLEELIEAQQNSTSKLDDILSAYSD